MNLSRVALSLVCSVALLGSISGCKREERRSKEFTPPNPDAPALYGPMTNAVPVQAVIARTSEPFHAAWTSAPLAVLQTELSPATLIHSSSKHLSLFAGQTNAGLSAPSHIAWSKIEGPRSYKQGEKLDVAKMQEGWVLVWWAGAAGWSNHWDAPWAVFLQHQPKLMKLDADGLHFEFPSEAGDVVMMPLHGYEKASPPGKDYRAEHGLTKRKVPLKTWEWSEAIRRDALTRLRYWASVTRELPIRCEESFSVDRANDAVTIRSRFERHSIRDDWNTPPLKLAPISPTLMLAVKSGAFPARFSRSWFDLEMPTPYGPLAAVEGVDEFDVTLSVLQYVNETEAVPVPDTNAHPTAARAWTQLDVEARSVLSSLHGGGEWSEMLHAATTLAKVLPFLEATTRSNALASLSRFFREEVLTTNRLSREKEAGKISRVLLEALWAGAHFSGDWTLVREHWPLIRGFSSDGNAMRWASFGPAPSSTPLGEQTACGVALARLAWQAGDRQAYGEACAALARGLTQLSVRQRGAEYFRQLQPWHTMEFMDDEVFVAQADETMGWQLDGPKFPASAKERPFNRRWERFHDVDAARYLREHYGDELRREMHWLQHRRGRDQSLALTSLIRLRSLLLNESPAGLEKEAMPDQFNRTSVEKLADGLAVLRAASPLRYQRLIPPGPMTPFALGAEREATVANPTLLTSVSKDAKKSTWPELTWPAWQTPTGAPWSFGQIRASRTASPQKVRELPLNSNSRVLIYE